MLRSLPFVPPLGATRLTLRRAAFAGLVLATMAAALAALTYVLGADGLSIIDLLMLAAFLITLPWTVIGFWNAVIGLLILHFAHDPVAAVVPLVRDLDNAKPLRGRTALVMPVFEEDPERVIRHLRTTVDSLDATGEGAGFEVFLLSDTQDTSIAEQEVRRFADWKASNPRPERLHYRRRAGNGGHKTGNIWEFIESSGERFDYMIVLDADSLMTGPALTRLVRLMDAHPRLGILQTLGHRAPEPERLRPALSVRDAPRHALLHDGQRLVAGRWRPLLGPQCDPSPRRFPCPLPTADHSRPAALRRPHPQPRPGRGGADAARRLRGAGAAG